MSCYCIISYFNKHDIDACLLNIIIQTIENKYNYCPIEERCTRCDRYGHEKKDCYSRRHNNGKELVMYKKNKCYLCFRDHDMSECNANIDIYGNYL